MVRPFNNGHVKALEKLTVGVGGTGGREQGAGLPVLKTSIQQTYFSFDKDALPSGSHMRITPQASLANILAQLRLQTNRLGELNEQAAAGKSLLTPSDDPAKLGTTPDGVPILALRDLPKEAKPRNLQLAIVAVPAESAQPVTEMLVTAGIKAILNFAPGRLRAPKDVRFKSVDLSIELETLSFYLVQGLRT